MKVEATSTLKLPKSRKQMLAIMGLLCAMNGRIPKIAGCRELPKMEEQHGSDRWRLKVCFSESDGHSCCQPPTGGDRTWLSHTDTYTRITKSQLNQLIGKYCPVTRQDDGGNLNSRTPWLSVTFALQLSFNMCSVSSAALSNFFNLNCMHTQWFDTSFIRTWETNQITRQARGSG